MIRYKNEIYWDYFINPETGVITDEYGNELSWKMSGNYPYVNIHGKKLPVHCVQAHTYYGYRPKNIVHHIDENTLNNDLYNLDYEHDQKWHGYITMIGRKFPPCSQERKDKISAANKGKKHAPESIKTRKLKSIAMMGNQYAKGFRWWHKEGEKPRFQKECPGEGWEIGR